MLPRKSLDPLDNQNYEVLRFLTMVRPQNTVILDVFNFFKEHQPLKEGTCESKCLENNKRGSLNETVIDARQKEYTAKSHNGKKLELNMDSPSSHSPSPFLSYNCSSLEDLAEIRSDTSFACTEHVWDSDRKYSISRFNYNGEVYDEIMRRMSNEDSNMQIKDNTKVGEHQFLTYQIIIKTSDSIYFIKPKDKKCFLLNKSSVSEMVAPTKTFNSAGDEISVAKFAFVELKNGSTSNSQKSTLNNYEDTCDSKFLFSSSESEPFNRSIIDSQSDSEQTIYTESQLSVKRWGQIPELSKALSKSTKRVFHQQKKMSFATFSRPYHFNNIVLYSTRSSCQSDFALQNKYFSFLKNQIQNKGAGTLKEKKSVKQSSGDQNPERKNTALTSEFVDHFWEKNKLNDLGVSFNMKPEFYSKPPDLQGSRQPQDNDREQAATLSDVLNRPSKHDSLLSTLLDLKLRDIMSYVWNSSSRTRLGRIGAPPKMSNNENKTKTEDLPGKQEKCVDQIAVLKASEKETLLRQDSTKCDSTLPKVNVGQSNFKKQASEMSGHTQVTISTCTEDSLNTEKETTSKATSLYVNTYSSTRKESEDVLQIGYSYISLAQRKHIENGDNSCVLALVVNEDERNSKIVATAARKRDNAEISRNIVRKSNEELQSLISMVDPTPISSGKSNSNNSKLFSSNSSKTKGNKVNAQSQATLSLSSCSYGDKQATLNKNNTNGQETGTESMYSNVWRNQKLAHESMLERVIPEDSVLSICALSSASELSSRRNIITNSASSRHADVLSEDHFVTISRTCPQCEAGDISSSCNLSVLAVESHECHQFFETKKESQRKRRTSTHTENEMTAVNKQSASTNHSDPLNNRAPNQASLHADGIKRKLRKRKSIIESSQNRSEGRKKELRRSLTVQTFNSERSLKMHKSRRRSKKLGTSREQRFLSSRDEGMNGQRKTLTKRTHSSRGDHLSNISCQYKHDGISCLGGNFAIPKISSVMSFSQKGLHKRKQKLQNKFRDSNIAVVNSDEGSLAATSRKTHKKKGMSRRKCDRKEGEATMSTMKVDSNYKRRKLLKHFKFNKNYNNRDRSCMIDLHPESRHGSESSLSSYKSVHSYLQGDDISYKPDNESDSFSETNKNSAVQTFIGPSAIDGMLNIINLFYARRNPDECSC